MDVDLPPPCDSVVEGGGAEEESSAPAADAFVERTADDDRKVFVSRIPSEWEADELKRVFEAAFGVVADADVRQRGGSQQDADASGGGGAGTGGGAAGVETNPTPSNFGFVTFENPSSKAEALAVGVLKRQRHRIQIRDIDRSNDGDEETTTTGVCYLWQRGICVHGAKCRFSHAGEGSCAPKAGEGRAKKCFAFKKTGKCKRGDACPFAHVASAAAVAPAVEDATTTTKAPGICRVFKKKGKCRKGDKCRYLHVSAVAGGNSETPPPEDAAAVAEAEAKRSKKEAKKAKRKAAAAADPDAELRRTEAKVRKIANANDERQPDAVVKVGLDNEAVVIGRRGKTIRMIEEESGARIQVKRGFGEVCVTGDDVCVAKARRLIDELCQASTG